MKDNSMITYRMFVQRTVTRSIIVENTVTRPIIVEDAKDLEEAKRKAINEWSNLTGGSLDTGEVIQSWIVNVGNGQTLIQDETSMYEPDES